MENSCKYNEEIGNWLKQRNIYAKFSVYYCRKSEMPVIISMYKVHSKAFSQTTENTIHIKTEAETKGTEWNFSYISLDTGC